MTPKQRKQGRKTPPHLSWSPTRSHANPTTRTGYVVHRPSPQFPGEPLCGRPMGQTFYTNRPAGCPKCKTLATPGPVIGKVIDLAAHKHEIRKIREGTS